MEKEVALHYTLGRAVWKPEADLWLTSGSRALNRSWEWNWGYGTNRASWTLVGDAAQGKPRDYLKQPRQKNKWARIEPRRYRYL